MIEAIAEILQSRVIAEPFECLEVRDAPADAELHEEVRPEDGELREDGVLVVAVERLEVGLELRVGERIERQRVELFVPVFVKGEDVVELDLRAEAELDIVAEEKTPAADRDEIPRNAVVLRRDPLGRDQAGLDRAEDFLARGVELLETGAQIVAVRCAGARAGSRKSLARARCCGAVGAGGVGSDMANANDRRCGGGGSGDTCSHGYRRPASTG